MQTHRDMAVDTDKMDKSQLFSPLTIRGITLKNRVIMSPMCQYSSINGKATDWHFVHLGSRAVGGCAAVVVEATAVEARGRISPEDMGLWQDDQIAPLEKCTAFIRAQNCVPAIQLAHAGRKACTRSPWNGGGPIAEGDAEFWRAVAPSAVPFDTGYQTPNELAATEIKGITQAFVDAAKRSIKAGFAIIELHAAHGYLFHEFLSPFSNKRTDNYGGSLENRMRFLIETVDAVRAAIPRDMPLFTRISATDWVEGGWDLPQSVELSKVLKTHGVDLIDCSSGANIAHAKIPASPGYQVPFAEAIKKEAGILTAAVGLIKKAEQADDIIKEQKADLVFLGRELLRDPYWPLHASKQLQQPIDWPVQYLRGRD